MIQTAFGIVVVVVSTVITTEKEEGENVAKEEKMRKETCFEKFEKHFRCSRMLFLKHIFM